MRDEKLRKLAADFLRKHGHPGYAKKIEYTCAYEVIDPLLKHYGKRELLRLYSLMSEELKRGCLFWFIVPNTDAARKVASIDKKYRYLREGWRYSPEHCSRSELKNYFEKLEDVILSWLGRKK